MGRCAPRLRRRDRDRAQGTLSPPPPAGSGNCLANRLRNSGHDALLVAESGIHTRADVERLRSCGAGAILVGESLMRHGNIAAKVDELLSAERQAFDPAKRKKLLSQAMGLITDEAPAQFMWRHQLLFGLAKNVDYRPLPSERIYGWNMKVR